MFNIPSFSGFKQTEIDPNFPFYEAEYQAVLNYAQTRGYRLPSINQRGWQSTLITDLKNAGFWNRIDSFASFATNGDSNFALIDWKRLVSMTAINAPNFAINQGFKGNLTSAYINTNYQPNIDAVNYTQDSAGVTIGISEAGTDGRYVVGTASGLSPEIRMRVHSNPGQALDSQINSATDTQNQNFNSNQVGNFFIDRTNSASFRLQFGTTLSPFYNAASAGVPVNPLWVLRITTQYADQRISYFMARNGFNTPDKFTLNNIMTNYLFNL
jgi:hypothetical protein